MKFIKRRLWGLLLCFVFFCMATSCSVLPQKEYERAPSPSVAPTESPEEKLKRETIENYEYQYEDSAGIYYIGNGQVIEYVHNSFAELCYTIDHLTQYQKPSAEETVDGRYVLIEGTVTQVSGDGEVTILCLDEEASKKAQLMWPMEAFANVTLVEEQEDILGAIAINDNIALFAKIDTDETPLVFSGYNGYDGVALSINGSTIDIPVVEKLMDRMEGQPEDAEKYVGMYYSEEFPDSYIDVEAYDANQLHITVQDYRITLADAYVDIPTSNAVELISKYDSPVAITFHPDKGGLFLAHSEDIYGGWYFLGQ